MTKFTVFFNNWSNTANCQIKSYNSSSREMTVVEAVPADIWQDWVEKLKLDDFRIEDSLMYKRINPNVPERGRKPHNFSFTIEGEGQHMHIISSVQEGPFYNRPATKEEQLFREWFIHLCKQKFMKTPKF